MMITRFVRTQLLVLTVLGSLSIGVLGVVYAKVPALLGYDRMTVTARFAEGSGLYPDANVTYRGVQIGTVTELRLSPSGLDVVMSIDDDAKVPSGTNAEIHQVSAIGEQYVDLVPHREGGPFLQDGSFIGASRTSVPPGIPDVLEEVNKLVKSVPVKALNTVVEQAYAAFNGTGPDLARLLDAGQQLIRAANESFAPTEDLIQDVGPLLETQRVSSDAIRSYWNDLASFSEQIRKSDKALRTVLETIPSAAAQLTGLANDLRPVLPSLLSNLTSLGKMAATYNSSIEQLLVLYPRVIAMDLSIVAGGDLQDALALGLRISYNSPPACTTGYLPEAGRRAPMDISYASTPQDLYCKLPQDDPTAVRGARNYPCQAVPGKRAATVQDCREGEFQALRQSNPPFAAPSPLAPVLPYNSLNPDDMVLPLALLGAPEPMSNADATWRDLLMPEPR